MTMTLTEWSFTPSGLQPHEITMDSAGNIWFTGLGAWGTGSQNPPGTLVEFNPNTSPGVAIEIPIPGFPWGRPEYLAADQTKGNLTVWFIERSGALLSTTPSMLLRLTTTGANSPTAFVLGWVPENHATYPTCSQTNPPPPWPPGSTVLHGLDVVRSQTPQPGILLGGIHNLWMLNEDDACSGATGPIMAHLPYGAGPPYTLPMFSYHPLNLPNNSAGDFLLADNSTNHTVWFATDTNTSPPLPGTIYHFDPSMCKPIQTSNTACRFETWPTYPSAVGSASQPRPQGLALPAPDKLWIEDRCTPPCTIGGLTGTIIELQNPTVNPVSIQVWLTPHFIPFYQCTGGCGKEESDLVAPSPNTVWFTEHGGAWSSSSNSYQYQDPTKFVNDLHPNNETKVYKSYVNVSYTPFLTNASLVENLNMTLLTPPISSMIVTCNGPGGFSECPVNLPTLMGAGPNGIYYQSSASCVWFTEQSVDKIGRLCPAPIPKSTFAGYPLLGLLSMGIGTGVIYMRGKILRRRSLIPRV